MFEHHIQYLTSKFEIIPFSTFLNTEKHCTSSVAITFDDGYRTILNTALPIMERYHCPFKIFFNGAQVKGALSWLNKLSAIISNSSYEKLSFLATLALPNVKNIKPNEVYYYWNNFIPNLTTKHIDKFFDELSIPDDQLFLNEKDIKTLISHPLIEC